MPYAPKCLVFFGVVLAHNYGAQKRREQQYRDYSAYGVAYPVGEGVAEKGKQEAQRDCRNRNAKRGVRQHLLCEGCEQMFPVVFGCCAGCGAGLLIEQAGNVLRQSGRDVFVRCRRTAYHVGSEERGYYRHGNHYRIKKRTRYTQR